METAPPLETAVQDTKPPVVSVLLGIGPSNDDFIAPERTRRALGIEPNELVTLILAEGKKLTRPVRRAPLALTQTLRERPSNYLFVSAILLESVGLRPGQRIEARQALVSERPFQEPTPAEVRQAAIGLDAELRGRGYTWIQSIGMGRHHNQPCLYVYQNSETAPASQLSETPEVWGEAQLTVFIRPMGDVVPAMRVPKPPEPKPDEGKFIGYKNPELAPVESPLDRLAVVEDDLDE